MEIQGAFDFVFLLLFLSLTPLSKCAAAAATGDAVAFQIFQLFRKDYRLQSKSAFKRPFSLSRAGLVALMGIGVGVAILQLREPLQPDVSFGQSER